MGLLEKLNKYLEEVLCVQYTGTLLYFHQEDSDEYKLTWPLNPDDNRPLVLMGQFDSEDDFYKYIIKEIKNKRFHLFKNFRAYRVPKDQLN